MHLTPVSFAVALLIGASLAASAHATRGAGVTPGPSAYAPSSAGMSAARVSAAGQSVSSSPAPTYVPPPPKPALPTPTPALQPYRPSPMSPPAWSQPALKRPIDNYGPITLRHGFNERSGASVGNRYLDYGPMARRDAFNARSIGGAADVNRKLQERAYRAARLAETPEGAKALKKHPLLNDQRNGSPLLPPTTARGDPITYQTLNLRTGGHPRRLSNGRVTVGSDGSMWVSRHHGEHGEKIVRIR